MAKSLEKVVRLLIVTLAASQLIKTHVAEAAKVRINPASKRSSLLRQASYSEQLKLQCKTRWFLQITEDGVVAGSANVSSPYVKLELQVVGPSLYRIKGVKSRRYLAMNKGGILISQTSISDETIFKYNKAADKFWTFSSHKYYRSRLHDMYVAIRKNGRSKKGLKTNILSKTTWFLHINK